MFQENYILFFFIVFSLFLSSIIYGLSFILIKQKDDAEKLKSYECGFDQYNDARKIFDIRFYLIAILFIIFDLESIFIFPWVLTLENQFSFSFWIMIDFLIELIVGYIYVWLVKALEWH